MIPDSFREALAESAERIRELPEDAAIRIVSHFDADGLAACAILAIALERDGRKPEIEVVPNLDSEAIARFSEEEFLLLVDVGSAEVAAEMSERTLLIDHHRHEGEMGILNPWRHGLDGGRDACSATLAFFLAQELDSENREYASLALVGIIADAQEKQGLQGLNREVVEQGIREGLIAREERLRLFGYERKGLVGLLIGSHDLKIPGVTGNPIGAKKFLARIGIPLLNRWDRETRYQDLDEGQREALLEAGKKAATRQPATVPYFTLLKERGMLRDARQFSTLLNACGRLERWELAIAICEGDEEARSLAPDALREYKEKLHDAYEWVKGSQDVIRTERYVIIDARSDILPSIMGTVCSMMTRGGDVAPGTYVLGLARNRDGTTKVSLRVGGQGKEDLNSLLSRMMEGFEGSSGGHAQAAGAVIRTEDEEEFIARAEEVLGGEEDDGRAEEWS